MTPRRRSLAALVGAPFLAAWLLACGEEGQSIGEGQCPVLPIYHWQYTDAGGWKKVTPTGTTPDQNAIDQATKDQTPNGRCQTPAGTATTIGAKPPPGAGGANTGSGGAPGAGGTKSTGGAGGAKGGTGGAKGGTGGVGGKTQDAGKD